MITQLLQKLGLFVGWILQENCEAVWFLERNESLLQAYGGSWENPEGILRLLQHSGMRSSVVRHLGEEIRSPSFLQYTGLRRAPSFWTNVKHSGAWGWKDPRNCFTLPIWLDLFPGARIVHIARHPLDVALSLQRRGNWDLQRRLMKCSKATKASKAAVTSCLGIRAEAGMLYWYRKFWQFRQMVAGNGRYEKFRIPATTALDLGVKLWIIYSVQVQECRKLHGLEWYECRYEDFVESPERNIRALAEFCKLRVDSVSVKKHCEYVRHERCFRFVERPDAVEVFERYRNDHTVKLMGY